MVSGWVKLTVGAVGAVGAVAAATAGVAAERRVVRSRQAGAAGADEMGALRGEERTVTTTDGLRLHAEVDEVSPHTEGEKHRPARAAAPSDTEPTIVFVHGYALNLDCWYFQRAYFRGKNRLVLYDQRSHGRSDRSEREHATVDQLGHDLRTVLEDLVPEGPVVLVGHSMGGMIVMAFARLHPDVFDARVVGVALVATAAGGLKSHHVVSRLIPDALAEQVAPRLVAGLARAPELVDRVRRRGSNLGFVMAAKFAFGQEVPPSYVEFVDNMLAGTSFEVLAQFFPNFDTFDEFGALDRLRNVATYVVAGTKDALTPVEHSRAMARRMPWAHLVECLGAGHLVILEQKDAVNAALDDLVADALRERPARLSP